MSNKNSKQLKKVSGLLLVFLSFYLFGIVFFDFKLIDIALVKILMFLSLGFFIIGWLKSKND